MSPIKCQNNSDQFKMAPTPTTECLEHYPSLTLDKPTLDYLGLKDENSNDLTEIQQFYNKKNVLITGATGFLGKVLMEKLLRSCPGVENLYLLVRQKRGKDIYTRMEEIFDDPIFDRLKEELPKFRHKVVVVPGDCDSAGLGLTITDRQMLIDKVNIIFHSAATVKFDEHLRTALVTNVRAPLFVLELAKNMQGLDVFMHISTAYSNSHLDTIDEKFYDFPTTADKLQRVVDKMTDQDIESATSKLLGPWPNTYTFTKALAEKEIRENAGKVPVGIFRPAIVTSTAKEPLRCWLDNMYGPTGVAVGGVTGILRTIHCDERLTADIVPVDLVVNCLLAAACSVHNKYRQSPPDEPPIFNYVNSPDNSITWRDFRAKNLINIDHNPFSNAVWYISITMNRSALLNKICLVFLHLLPAMLVDGLAICIGKKPKMLKVYRKIHKFSSVLSYFTTKELKFHNQRVQNLWLDISDKDKQLFPFNMKELDWDEYFDHYLIGIRRYLFKEKDSTIPRAIVKWRRLYYLHQIVKVIFRCLLVYVVWCFINLLL